jgi:hypothetical protein
MRELWAGGGAVLLITAAAVRGDDANTVACTGRWIGDFRAMQPHASLLLMIEGEESLERCGWSVMLLLWVLEREKRAAAGWWRRRREKKM